MLDKIFAQITSTIEIPLLLSYIQSGRIALNPENMRELNTLLTLTLRYVKANFRYDQETEKNCEAISKKIHTYIQKKKFSVTFLYVPIIYSLLAIIEQQRLPTQPPEIQINAFALFAETLSRAITLTFRAQSITTQQDIADKFQERLINVIKKNKPDLQEEINWLIQPYCLFLYYITPKLHHPDVQDSLLFASCFQEASKEETVFTTKILANQLTSYSPIIEINLRPHITYLNTLFTNSPPKQMLNILQLAKTIDPSWIITYVQTGEVENCSFEISKVNLLSQTIKMCMPQITTISTEEISPTIIEYHAPVELLGLSLVLLHATNMCRELSIDASITIAMFDFIRLFCIVINLYFEPLQQDFSIVYRDDQCCIVRENMTCFLKAAFTNLNREHSRIAKLYFDYWRLCLITITPGLYYSNFDLELLPHFSEGLRKQELDDGLYCVYTDSVGEIMSVLAYAKIMKPEQSFAPMFFEHIEATTTQMLEGIRRAAQQKHAIFDIPTTPPTLQDIISLIYTSINTNEIVYYLSTNSFLKKNYEQHLLRNFINILYMIIWYLNAYIYPNRFNRTKELEEAELKIDTSVQLTSAITTISLQTAPLTDIFFITIILTATTNLIYDLSAEKTKDLSVLLSNLVDKTNEFTVGCITYLYSQQEKRYPKRTNVPKGRELEKKVAYRKSDVNVILLEALKKMTSGTNKMETLFRNYIFYLYTTTTALRHEERLAYTPPPFTIEAIASTRGEAAFYKVAEKTISALADLILEIEELPQTYPFQNTLLGILQQICATTKLQAPDEFKKLSRTYGSQVSQLMFMGIDPEM